MLGVRWSGVHWSGRCPTVGQAHVSACHRQNLRQVVFSDNRLTSSRNYVRHPGPRDEYVATAIMI